jgi:hypothetical protein
MIKKTFIVLALSLFSLVAFAQKNKGLSFDVKDFNQKAETAEWLYVYDCIAWWTSDSVMAQDTIELKRLGKEWFCYQTNDKNWHAIYGKYENSQFDLVFHYLVDTLYKVKRIYEPVDTAILNGYSRALYVANEYVKPQKSANLSFNQFIKQNEDKTFNVWIFPAFQKNAWAIYGKEFILKIDKSGQKIIEDNSYYDTEFRGFEVKNEPREVWIDQTQFEKPTLGVVFFVWYYKKYFTYIKIDNKNYVSTTIKDGNSYSWFHIEKEMKKK